MKAQPADLRSAKLASTLRESLTENIGLKTASVIISVVLFSAVRGSGNVQRSLDVPATFVLPVSATGNAVLLSSLPDKVRVTVRGLPSVLGAIRADDIGPLQIDVREGRNRQVRLHPEMLTLPAGATFVSFTPDSIPLQWDTMVDRSVPVQPTIVGTLAPRARIEHIEVEPSHIHVRGASLYVDPMTSVHTEPIDVSDLTPGRYERRIPLEPARSGVEFDTARGVRVAFEVAVTVYERRFSRLAVTAVGTLRAQLRPPVVDVIVRGDPAVVDRLLPSQVVPTVDLSAIAAAHTAVSVPVEVRPLPEGASVGDRSPAEILVVPLR